MARKNGGSTGADRDTPSRNWGSTPLWATVIFAAGMPYRATTSSRVNPDTVITASDHRMLAGTVRFMYARSSREKYSGCRANATSWISVTTGQGATGGALTWDSR